MVKNMDRAEIIQDFKEFFKENQKEILSQAVNIEDLPSDDDWVLDDEWDMDTPHSIISKR